MHKKMMVIIPTRTTYLYDQLIFDRGTDIFQSGKDNLFNKLC